MKHLPSALFFIDGIHERIAISEAQTLGIPVFGIGDSNTDPSGIDYPIPANDDSLKTIKLLLEKNIINPLYISRIILPLLIAISHPIQLSL